MVLPNRCHWLLLKLPKQSQRGFLSNMQNAIANAQQAAQQAAANAAAQIQAAQGSGPSPAPVAPTLAPPVAPAPASSNLTQQQINALAQQRANEITTLCLMPPEN